MGVNANKKTLNWGQRSPKKRNGTDECRTGGLKISQAKTLEKKKGETLSKGSVGGGKQGDRRVS